MALSPIPGYIATLSVDAQPVNLYTSQAGLTLNTSEIDVTTLGKAYTVVAPGLRGGTLSISMHLDTAGAALMQTAWAKQLPVAFVFRPGDTGSYNAGQWAGSCVITALEIPGSVDDNWQMNLSAVASDEIVYTPPA